MFLVWVTERVTLPLGGRIYRPDPAQQAWASENARLQKAGVKARQRPKALPPHKDYPSKA
jgi:hypothetical protein